MGESLKFLERHIHNLISERDQTCVGLDLCL